MKDNKEKRYLENNKKTLKNAKQSILLMEIEKGYSKFTKEDVKKAAAYNPYSLYAGKKRSDEEVQTNRAGEDSSRREEER